jgi:hypothetical protein
VRPAPQGAFGTPQSPYGPQPSYPVYPAPQPGAGHLQQLPPYAGWPRRAGAFLLDIVINFAPMCVLTGVGARHRRGR